jgi:hypothetical protein
MSRKALLHGRAPTFVVGALRFAAYLVSAWYITSRREKER